LNILRGSITLDTSAIIEYLMGTELGQIVKEYFQTLKPGEKVYCCLYSLSEMVYVLCRLKGLEYTTEKINFMLSSQVVEIENTKEMAMEAGRLKCERAISIGDCSCIATAKITGSRAVFARRERDLVNEMKKRPFDVEITFLAKESQ
jgi:predicted nucleic acid-binding protein